jgi:hypothetical protein
MIESVPAFAMDVIAHSWRVVRTMGSRIAPHLHPVEGFAAELPPRRPSAWPLLPGFPSPPLMRLAAPSPVWAPHAVCMQFDGSGRDASFTDGSLPFQAQL